YAPDQPCSSPGKRGLSESGNPVKNHMYDYATSRELRQWILVMDQDSPNRLAYWTSEAAEISPLHDAYEFRGTNVGPLRRPCLSPLWRQAGPKPYSARPLRLSALPQNIEALFLSWALMDSRLHLLWSGSSAGMA